jgi:transposase
VVVTPPPDLSKLTSSEKDALILAQAAQLQAALARIEALEKQLERLLAPPKTPDNSSLPPSKGQKPNRPDKPGNKGPRQGSLGRKGGGRVLAAHPDEVVVTKPARCQCCHAVFGDEDHTLNARYDKIELPQIRPVVTRVERYSGACRACGATTLAPVPEGLEAGTPFSLNIMALAIYLRVTHAISYQRLSRLFMDLFGLAISQGALDAAFRRCKPRVDAEVAAILARLRRARVIYSDETGVRIDGKGHWNWVFQNDDVVIHIVRASRGACVVAEVLDGHRPALWVSDLYGAQQGHAEAWQVCLAHQLRDCQYAIDAGDTVFAPRMKALLLRAVVIARRRRALAESTRRAYRRRLERDLDGVMALAPATKDGQRLRRRYGKVRSHLFTFLDHPEITADNNSSERELRPTATYRKVTGGFRSGWAAEFYAGVRSVIGTAKRRGIDAYQAIIATLSGQTILPPG